MGAEHTLPGQIEIRRKRLDGQARFAAASLSLVTVFAASASPIPLYESFRSAAGLDHADLALAAVVYFISVMAALIVCGRLSNYFGRRPLALIALGLTGAGCLVLTHVDGEAPLLLGRLLQGLGCGLASSALTALIVDSAPPNPSWLGSATTAASPMLGLTIGALGSGLLAGSGEGSDAPVFWIGAAALALCAVLIALSRETVSPQRQGALPLRPQISIPPAARALFPAAACTFFATWALGGFFQAFGPSVAAEQLGTDSTLVAAAVFASLMAPSALGAPLVGRIEPAKAQRLGMLVFLTGVGILLVSLSEGFIALFLLGSGVAGLAQGATFAASMRSLLSRVDAAERAGTLSAIYLVSYGGAAIPGLVAGQLAETMSLLDIALGYGALAAVATAMTLLLARDPTSSGASRHDFQDRSAQPTAL